MSAVAQMPVTAGLNDLKNHLKATWMAGDYDAFARYMEKDSEPFFERLTVQPGSWMLDVACGAGQLALIAARAGVVATGCDIATNWVEKAKQRAAAEGLKATFEEGDAEALPYLPGQFDLVTTLFGAMFAPRPELVAAELTRVCRPGGRIAMANWTPNGFIGQMFKVIAKHIAPSGMPSPALWGDEATVRQRLHDGIAKVECTSRMFHFEYPFAPAEVVEFFRINYGPMSRAFASLDAAGQARLRAELVKLWSDHNVGNEGTTRVDAEYLEVVATRG
jgi:ubiquinone/menaquinone biosynthesis C-methylase UbiE